MLGGTRGCRAEAEGGSRGGREAAASKPQAEGAARAGESFGGVV